MIYDILQASLVRAIDYLGNDRNSSRCRSRRIRDRDTLYNSNVKRSRSVSTWFVPLATTAGRYSPVGRRLQQRTFSLSLGIGAAALSRTTSSRTGPLGGTVPARAPTSPPSLSVLPIFSWWALAARRGRIFHQHHPSTCANRYNQRQRFSTAVDGNKR